MSIASAICNSFKVEILKAVHNFNTSGGNTFNLAMYTSSATLGATTTAYATNPGGGSNTDIENTSGSSYSAKGKALTTITPVLNSTTAVVDFDNISWTSASFTANGCLIFNDTASGDPACCTIAFGGDKTVTSGTFTIEFPAATAGNAIIGIA
jgi:hypothetical protein